MKKVFDKYFYLLIIIFLNLIFLKNIFLASLDGTSNIVYQPQHWVFHGGDKAQGFVRLNAGFTVLPGATGQLDTVITISGPIDLKETGTLDLLKDLELDSGVTLSSGGCLYGRQNGIFLNGSLTIPTSKIFRITGDSFIDGLGNNLILSNKSQIWVDTNVTLTLRNLRLKNIVNTADIPAIRLSNKNSRLDLDNVILDLSDNFVFKMGSIYINNDVLFTGTSGFIYQSNQGSFITQNSNLFFDKGTTFSYYPEVADRDLIIMNDKSSSLHFDGCNLDVTVTGLRLAKGRVFFDNKIQIKSGGTPVTILNGLIFGNTGLGETYNLNANILSGSLVTLSGLLNDDSV